MAHDETPNPELQRLDAFVGGWEIAMDVPGQPGERARAETSFEWLEGGRFLIQRSTADDPFPDGISVIGWDEERGGCLIHYFDSRGVKRLYDLSFDGTELKMSRDVEEGDFAQRFTGRLSEDRATMDARWERSDDGVNWELDFELTYTKTN